MSWKKALIATGFAFEVGGCKPLTLTQTPETEDLIAAKRGDLRFNLDNAYFVENGETDFIDEKEKDVNIEELEALASLIFNHLHKLEIAAKSNQWSEAKWNADKIVDLADELNEKTRLARFIGKINSEEKGAEFLEGLIKFAEESIEIAIQTIMNHRFYEKDSTSTK